MKNILTSILITLFLLDTSAVLTAQSTDPDNPTPLGAEPVTMNFTKEKTKYYYTFMALEGELKLTADVLGSYPWLQISCKLKDADFKGVGSPNSAVWHGRKPAERYVLKSKIKKAQKVILVIDPVVTSVGTLTLKIEGAVQFEKKGRNSPPPTVQKTSVNKKKN